MDKIKPMAFMPAQGSNTSAEDKMAHALEFMAAHTLRMEDQFEELNRHLRVISSLLQTKLK